MEDAARMLARDESVGGCKIDRLARRRFTLVRTMAQ
jgi:hypothetical protein